MSPYVGHGLLVLPVMRATLGYLASMVLRVVLPCGIQLWHSYAFPVDYTGLFLFSDAGVAINRAIFTVTIRGRPASAIVLFWRPFQIVSSVVRIPRLYAVDCMHNLVVDYGSDQIVRY